MLLLNWFSVTVSTELPLKPLLLTTSPMLLLHRFSVTVRTQIPLTPECPIVITWPTWTTLLPLNQIILPNYITTGVKAKPLWWYEEAQIYFLNIFISFLGLVYFRPLGWPIQFKFCWAVLQDHWPFCTQKWNCCDAGSPGNYKPWLRGGIKYDCTRGGILAILGKSKVWPSMGSVPSPGKWLPSPGKWCPHHFPGEGRSLPKEGQLHQKGPYLRLPES